MTCYDGNTSDPLEISSMHEHRALWKSAVLDARLTFKALNSANRENRSTTVMKFMPANSYQKGEISSRIIDPIWSGIYRFNHVNWSTFE